MKKIQMFVLLFSISFIVAAATVNTPMTEDLNANGFDIFNVNDIISKRPRVDVRAFGANPDDTVDDTSAIQAAINYAESKLTTVKPTGSVYIGAAPLVYFPRGKYFVSNTLTAGSYINFTGDSAIIEMSDNTKDILSISCYTNNIKGLSFIGGKSHLVFYNPNIDTTKLSIRECEFHNSADFAIRLIPSGTADHLSALVNIHNSRFVNNYQALENYADGCNVVNCWVQTAGNSADAAVFVNQAGVLSFDNMFGVPAGAVVDGTRRINARWVDNYYSFLAINSRFGGENAGMPIVYNYRGISQSYPYQNGGRILISRSWICSGAAATNACVIKLFDVPQQVVIRDNSYLAESPYFLVDSSLDLDTCLDTISSLHTKIKYVIEPNLKWNAGDIPEQLRPFINPLSELYFDKPTSGHWKKGHILYNGSVNSNSHVGIINTEDGEPGKWGYFGKTSPFPIGAQNGSVISGNKGKYTFDIPESRNFTALVTIACNGNESGSSYYYKSQTLILSLDTGWDGSSACDYLSYTPLHTPAVNYPSNPTIESIHFGSGDTGSNKRICTTGGQATIVWNNCNANPQVSIETIFVKK